MEDRKTGWRQAKPGWREEKSAAGEKRKWGRTRLLMGNDREQEVEFAGKA